MNVPNKPKLMKKRANKLRLIATLALIATIFAFSEAIYARIYVYTAPDGSKLITDSPRPGKGYRLQKTLKTSPFRNGGGGAPYLASRIKSQYDAIITITALEYEVEPALVKAVMHVESAFDANAISKAGAIGLMQLMPATAKIYDLDENIFAAEENLEVGIKHLHYLLKRYKQNTQLALAAYNAGEGAVSKYDGIPPFQETQNYVRKVMHLYRQYQQKFS